MGLLDVLNGMQSGPRGATTPAKGGMSPLTMGLLALLAYKAYQKLTAPLNDTVPAGNADRAGKTPPADNDLSGALGNLLPGGLGGMKGLGGLGGLLAGAAGGGMLNGGLNDLLHKLDQNGLGEVGKSWVGTGQNKAISSEDLGGALDDDTVQALERESGLSRPDLLDALSRQLPQAIDHITPNGRIPTDREMANLL